MEQSSIANKQQEEPLAVEANIQQTTENASDATQGKTKTTAPDETTRPEKPHVNQKLGIYPKLSFREKRSKIYICKVSKRL